MENKKILIVDDNNLNRKVLENIICHNYEFESAENGLEAIGKIKKDIFHVILMDIQMPVMDGITALKIIKEEALTDAPIIAISAYSDQTDYEYFLSAGFDEFIAKPVKPKKLLESIQQHLSNYNNAPSSDNHQLTSDILDESVLIQLMKYNTLDNIKTVYEDFDEEAECLIDEIKHLIDVKKYSEIGEKLHILKGNSGTLGAKQLFKHVGIFEQKIKDTNFEDIIEDYLTLQNQLNIFKSHLKDKITHHKNE
ncbi:response regulator [Echinicola sp. CAU 1574]|uniref:Response regulator n=1 Tax=Echinicola arenosa TaxID=2774144 RepID=A0ABR9AFJ9_9BACT|nr:response regulator [Echinicola arenosa]MBD8487617.1 response regulator [Echinicola arenosa]